MYGKFVFENVQKILVYEHGETVSKVICSDLDSECSLILMPSHNNQYDGRDDEESIAIADEYVCDKNMTSMRQ